MLNDSQHVSPYIQHTLAGMLTSAASLHTILIIVFWWGRTFITAGKFNISPQHTIAVRHPTVVFLLSNHYIYIYIHLSKGRLTNPERNGPIQMDISFNLNFIMNILWDIGNWTQTTQRYLVFQKWPFWIWDLAAILNWGGAAILKLESAYRCVTTCF